MNLMGDNILGVIGGMGPLATEIFYRMIVEMTPATTDQEHLNMILLNHATMPDRTTAIKTGDFRELTDNLKRDLEFLIYRGASIIAVAFRRRRGSFPIRRRPCRIPAGAT